MALSHILPVLILVPLLGLALLYQLERRYYVDNLAIELEVQGALIAEFIQHDQSLWRDPNATVRMLENLQVHVPARVMLLDSDAYLLSSSHPADSERIGGRIAAQVVSEVLEQEEVRWVVDYSAEIEEEVIDIGVPVLNEQGTIAGIVRLSHSLYSIQGRLGSLRSIILLTVSIGGALTLVVGLLLAGSISAPLSQLTQTTSELDPHTPPQPLTRSSLIEIQTLATTINRLWENLYKSEQDRRRLLAGIVHEINRPLGAIKAAAQTIVSVSDPDAVTELATGIDEQVNQLQRQVEDLSLLGQIDLQQMVLDRQKIDFNQIVRDQCWQIALLFGRKHIHLARQLPDQPLFIYADAQRLHQLVGNVLHNAYKFTPEDGTITVFLHHDVSEPEYAVLSIQDTGPGIAPSEQTRIFDFFYRSPTQRIQQGIGLGLAIAKQIAEMHGGTLTVQSSTNQGTTFTIQLPAGKEN